MHKILNALKCVECQEVLETPVILPCNHSICKKHITNRDTLICGRCGVEHKNGHFPINEALSDIIAAQIASIDFGSIHKEATEACDRLEVMLKKVEYLLNDPTVYTYDKISELKIQVQTKSEQLKLRIDEETEKLFAKLTEYENRCKNMLKTEIYLRGKSKFELKHEAISANLIQFKHELNNLKFDESKWMKIKKTSNQTIRNLEEDLKLFKKDLLLNEFDLYKNDVDIFWQISIDQVFTSKINN